MKRAPLLETNKPTDKPTSYNTWVQIPQPTEAKIKN